MADFSFIKCQQTRYLLDNAWQAINLTESWDFMAEDIDNYMFSRNSKVMQISRKMEEIGQPLHSGASFGFVMRQMQYIAQNGLDTFKDMYMKNNK